MAEGVIDLLFGVDGGGSINGKSGQMIVADLTKIVNEINSGKSKVPKIKLEFDVTGATKAVEKLAEQLRKLETAGGSGNSGSQATQRQSEQYNKLTAQVKEYYRALAEMEKIQLKNSAVSSSGGTWTSEDPNYQERVANITKIQNKLAEMGIVANNSNQLQMTSAQALGLSEREYSMLVDQNTSAIQANSVAHERSQDMISKAWSGNSAKAIEYINKIRGMGNMKPQLEETARELEKMAMSGDPANLDALTSGMSRFRQEVHKTGADVETWGHKLKKTFGSQLRYMLTSMVYMKALQFVRDLYNNVVELDKAMTNLQIASGKTRAEVKELTKGYAELAKQLGATTTEVAESADTWLRQGHAAEEANILIKNSTMLAKLGQMEAAEASKALTSAMKGYKVEVKDSIRIVDKFTAVDMEAAASAGDIATAMAETATSADIAGVSMDKLIGYITTVKEVTQDGSESVGTFYKTLFARMNNVKAGKFVDDETGEDLNDVEKTLGKLGISLRDNNNLFRNSGEVLDEVAARWSSFDNVAQHAIATAFAGTRQQEKFIVLMENYGSALQYAETAANSAGTANEKFNAWLESIEGKLNSLKSSFQSLSLAVLDSNLITGAVGFVTWLLDGLTRVMDKIGGLNTILYVTLGILATIKADSILSFSLGFAPKVISLVTMLWSKVVTLAQAFHAAQVSGMNLGQSASAAFQAIGISATGAQVAVGALVAILGVVIIAVNAYNSAIRENINNALEAADAANAKGKEYLDEAKSIKDLIDEYEALAKANDGVFSGESAEKVRYIQGEITKLVGEQADKLDLVNGKLDDEIRKMRELATGAGSAVDNAIIQGNVQIAEATKAYKEKKRSRSDNHYDGDGYATGKNTQFAEEWASQFGVQVQEDVNYIEGWAIATGMTYELKTQFDTIEEFITQYESITAMSQKLAGEHGDSDLFGAASDFLSDYKDIYDRYQSGKSLIEEAEKVKNEIKGIFSNETVDNGITVALKSAYDILEEVQGGYDGLAKALSSVTSEGYLTADALSTLFELEKNNALAGLKLEEILIRDAKGYKLAENALQKYIQALIESYEAEYSMISVFASGKDRENAILNLETLQAVLATLVQTQNDSNEADKARRKELEKMQDSYDNQLDSYKELIDIRKDLLETYEEEVSYQKELAKRQRDVTSLQTKLSVARLDKSAAGQARVRELEEELREAQDELDDFTLEHAIEVLSDQLDNQYTEYELFIQNKLGEIEKLLEELDTNSKVDVTIDTSWIQNSLNRIETLITEIRDKPVEVDKDESYLIWFQGLANRDENGMPIAKNNSLPEGIVSISPEDDAYIRSVLKGIIPQYHTGGIVGNKATLDSSEEFAKLLKGEFVSTPSQMKRFMEETLPQITNYAANTGTNEFNAPLIEINCENVTGETLPELERIVDEAVKEVKKQLDSGMSRTGFKRQTTRRLQ